MNGAPAKARQAAYRRGIAAEHLAAIFLRFKGYRVLARRYKTPVGEIDLIVCRKNMLVFVEVKERSNIISALESVTPHMKKRITRAAHYYLASHPAVQHYDMRFDVVATRGLHIHHLDNAWQVTA